MGGREEETDLASEQPYVLHRFNIIDKYYYQYVLSSLDSTVSGDLRPSLCFCIVIRCK